MTPRSLDSGFYLLIWGGSSSSVISFCFLILFMGFSWQEYWNSLLFHPLVNHVLSELFTMTPPFEVALQAMAHSFIEFPKPLCHDKAVIHEGDKTPSVQFSSVAQSCLTLCDPMDCSSLSGSSVCRIFQARVLEWVATSFSRRFS